MSRMHSNGFDHLVGANNGLNDKVYFYYFAITIVFCCQKYVIIDCNTFICMSYTLFQTSARVLQSFVNESIFNFMLA